MSIFADLADVPTKQAHRALAKSEVPGPLMGLLRRLKTYAVTWNFTFVPSENTEYEPGVDRETRDLDDPEANVVSSELKAQSFKAMGPDGMEWTHRHVVAVDIDHPAWLVPSSTADHSHLYVDIPGGIAWEDYEAWLRASAKIGLLEDGYVDVSIKRGHTDLRLPWVKKSDQKKATADEMASRFAGETISPRVTHMAGEFF